MDWTAISDAALLARCLVAAGAAAFLLATSGKVVGYYLSAPIETGRREETEQAASVEDLQRSTGKLIGKCENLLILIFVLTNQYTAMALVFTAKTLVRKEDIQRDSRYFLAGTLINVTYSVFIGVLARVLLDTIR